jgi:hypothetical protein
MITRILQEESQFYRKLNPSKDFMYNMDQAEHFTVEPIDEKWSDVDYYGQSWLDPTYNVHKPEYVYVLVNPSMPGICKIGYTKKTVYERCRQINSATGVITPWYPVFVYKCPSGPLLEKEVHKYLENQGKRVNIKREGFEIDSVNAIKIIELIGDKYKNKQNEQ